MWPAWADGPSLTLDLVRREDMLALRFDFYNLVLSTGVTPPKLEPQDASKPSHVVVGFGSQHVMEQPVYESEAPPGPGKIHTRAVDGSRVAFLVPATVKSLPFTEEGLFGWWQWVMSVVPAALPPDADPSPPPPYDIDPGDLQTDLLLTDWVHLSPDRNSTWAHAARPVTRGGRTELWHTRLTLRASDGKPAITGPAATVRAIFTDVQDVPASSPFSIFEGPHPRQLVSQTSNFALDWVRPATVDLLLLSSMGSSLELEADWDNGPLAKWRHRSSIGRDNYVRVEDRGYLFPFGNRAVQVSETQRKIADDGTAYLIKRKFIVVREPIKTYPGPHQPHERAFPYRRIRVTTTVTPTLPQTPPERIAPGAQSFWIKVGDPAQDLPFTVVATDWAGAMSRLTCPVAFIYWEEATDVGAGTPLRSLLDAYGSYSGVADDERRAIVLHGQKVAYAAPTKPDDTAYPTARLYLGAEDAGQGAADDLQDQNRPNFFPLMLGADVRLPAVEAVSASGTTSAIGYDPVYVDTPTAQAADANPAALFARLQQDVESIGDLLDFLRNGDPDDPNPPNNPVGAAFDSASDKVGGVATPNLSIGALSKTYGPLSGSPHGLTKLQQGGFDPKDFFPDDAGLLGDLTLAELINPNLSLADGNSGPTIVTTTEYPDGDTSQPPLAVVTTLDWVPKLKTSNVGFFVPKHLDTNEPATLTLHGEFRTELATGTSTSTIHGELRSFTLDLLEPGTDLDFIAMVFDRFAFESRDGAKPSLDPQLSRVEFRGPLSFINTLQQFLATTGKGPSIDVQPSGVEVGYTLPIPDIAIGVFALQHLSFTAGLRLPFDGSAVTARFSFCSRENPFLVSVYVFAGGGFFALELGTDGLHELEAAVEFGGNLALDIVVASGSLTVMAGIYFKLEITQNGQGGESEEITLTGYLRATGRVSVLGLITISAEFYLGLSWREVDGNSVVEGEASLEVSIDLLVFSATVTLHVKKTFAGGGDTAAAALTATRNGRALEAASSAAAPEFAELISQQDWNAYCDAFAA
jgi:hypothetical protein